MPTAMTDPTTDPDQPGPPLHGYRGVEPAEHFAGPKGMTIAISREAGARGTTIAHKLGAILGWQVFDPEMLDYLMIDETGRAQLFAEVPSGAKAWADRHLARLQREGQLNSEPDTTALARLVLVTAARGDTVIVGRGAGFLLPPETTLHARVVAPFEARVSFMAQLLRLSREDAAAEVRNRDTRRENFLTRTLLREMNESIDYDVVVNSGRLGIEAAAQVVGWALRTKQQFAEIGRTTGDETFG
jgi:cytidylate kinase